MDGDNNKNSNQATNQRAQSPSILIQADTRISAASSKSYKQGVRFILVARNWSDNK